MRPVSIVCAGADTGPRSGHRHRPERFPGQGRRARPADPAGSPRIPGVGANRTADGKATGGDGAGRDGGGPYDLPANRRLLGDCADRDQLRHPAAARGGDRCVGAGGDADRPDTPSLRQCCGGPDTRRCCAAGDWRGRRPDRSDVRRAAVPVGRMPPADTCITLRSTPAAAAWCSPPEPAARCRRSRRPLSPTRVSMPVPAASSADGPGAVLTDPDPVSGYPPSPVRRPCQTTTEPSWLTSGPA